MPISLRSKILPIVTATALGAGALASCASNQQNIRTNETSYQKSVLLRTTEQMNDSLCVLNFKRADKTIDFKDYYTKAKDIIMNTKLDKNAVYNEAIENDEVVFKEIKRNDFKRIEPILIIWATLALTAGVLASAMYINDEDEEYCKAALITSGVCALFAASVLLIQNCSTKKHYIDDYVNAVQEMFDSYKFSKMNNLNAKKEEYLYNAEKVENTDLLDDNNFENCDNSKCTVSTDSTTVSYK